MRKGTSTGPESQLVPQRGGLFLLYHFITRGNLKGHVVEQYYLTNQGTEAQEGKGHSGAMAGLRL